MFPVKLKQKEPGCHRRAGPSRRRPALHSTGLTSRQAYLPVFEEALHRFDQLFWIAGFRKMQRDSISTRSQDHRATARPYLRPPRSRAILKSVFHAEADTAWHAHGFMSLTV